MAAKKSVFKNPPEREFEETVRTYYRHTTTGDRGYLVVENGETRVKLDRNGDPTTRRLDGNWEPETDTRPLLRHQLWRLTFEADKALCSALGLQSAANREWLNLSDEKRISWGASGPGGNVLRQKLFAAIMKAMKDEVQ